MDAAFDHFCPMPLKVLKSSAGSGKTYALVSEYLRLVLSDSKQPGYYRHILAITFTNAAALEMKERVMRQLSEFASGNALKGGSADLCNALSSALNIGPDEVRARAAEVYAHMLHHYGQLSILTIDSFTHRIVRSFARDLRLSPDFQVEMDVDKLVSETVDRLLEFVGEDKEISEYLLSFCQEKLEEEKNWDVRTDLQVFAKQMFREEVDELNAALEGKSLQEVTLLRSKLRTQLAQFWDELKALAQACLDMLNKHGVKESDLKYGGSGTSSVWRKIIRDQEYKPGVRWTQFLDGQEMADKKKLDAAIYANLFAIEGELRSESQKIDRLFRSGRTKAILIEQILKHIVQMGLLRRMMEIAENVKEEENIRLISDFHKSVSNVVAQSSAPFIYERIGERYHHILFDEFQDTSSMQWRNFIPLIDNALARDGFNLIVGDGKQSIYRWRNGRVEQFVYLPRIDLDGIDESVKQQFQHAYQEEVLPRNFRSARTIVEFNNALFEALAQNKEAGRVVYANQAQEVVQNAIGAVEVVIAEKTKGEESEEEEKWRTNSKATFEAIEARVRECKDSGYAEGDIAILVRTGQEGRRIAVWLQEHGWKVASEESFALENSSEVRLTFALMQAALYRHTPELTAALMPMLATFSPDPQAATWAIAEHVQKEGPKLTVRWNDWVKTHLPAFHFPSISSLSPAAFADELIYRNGWTQNNFTERMLAELHALVSTKNAGYAEVIKWWDNHRGRIFVRSESDASAVKLLTVHKSKGLQYPVVIYPVFEPFPKTSEIWIDLNPEVFDLSGTLASVSSKPVEEEPPHFDRERNKVWLDDLNVLYVACTRPEDRLYLIIERKGAKKKTQEESESVSLYNDLVSWSIRQYGDAFDSNLHGEKQAPAQRRAHGREAINFASVERAPQEHGLRVIRPMKEDDPRIIGAQIHTMLSTVSHWEEFETLIESMDELNDEWKSRLRKMSQDQQLRDQFFTGEALVEQEMYDPELGWLRPDRVVLDQNELRVIDFKTGAPSDSHTAQVKQYCDLLANIRGLRARGFVYYIREGVLEEIEN